MVSTVKQPASPHCSFFFVLLHLTDLCWLFLVPFLDTPADKLTLSGPKSVYSGLEVFFASKSSPSLQIPVPNRQLNNLDSTVNQSSFQAGYFGTSNSACVRTLKYSKIVLKLSHLKGTMTQIWVTCISTPRPIPGILYSALRILSCHSVGNSTILFLKHQMDIQSPGPFYCLPTLAQSCLAA